MFLVSASSRVAPTLSALVGSYAASTTTGRAGTSLLPQSAQVCVQGGGVAGARPAVGFCWTGPPAAAPRATLYHPPG